MQLTENIPILKVKVSATQERNTSNKQERRKGFGGETKILI